MNWKKMEDLVDSNLAIRFPSRKYLDCLLLDFYINTMICRKILQKKRCENREERSDPIMDWMEWQQGGVSLYNSHYAQIKNWSREIKFQ